MMCSPSSPLAVETVAGPVGAVLPPPMVLAGAPYAPDPEPDPEPDEAVVDGAAASLSFEPQHAAIATTAIAISASGIRATRVLRMGLPPRWIPITPEDACGPPILPGRPSPAQPAPNRSRSPAAYPSSQAEPAGVVRSSSTSACTR